MAALYSLMHREAGPLATFTGWQGAEDELCDVLEDEPTWVGDLYIEPFDVGVAEQAEH